eukprot:gene39725-48366_t
MSSEVEQDQAKAKKLGRKRKKERKQVIELSLWINGCKYEFGLLSHNTKKRKHHVRSKLSHLNMERAAGLITRAVRRYGHIKLLQKSQYRKVFDRAQGRFYYAFHGRSSHLPRSSWRKPRLLGKRSFPKDLQPVYTPDVAALIVQRKWRSILLRQFFRALVRASYDEVWDPIKGRFNYYHRETAVLHTEKPPLLGNEPWDPNRVPDWTVERVSLFLRRIGLKQYVETMRSYHVDGNALVLLDDEDFTNLGITS